MLKLDRGEDSAVSPLPGPGGFQALLGFGIVTQIAGGLQKKVAVHHPEPAINRRANLKVQPAAFQLPSLKDVARAGRQKFPVALGLAPSDFLAEGTPTFPVLASRRQQFVRVIEVGAQFLDILSILRESEKYRKGDPEVAAPAGRRYIVL